jgi:hypothetical protein
MMIITCRILDPSQRRLVLRWRRGCHRHGCLQGDEHEHSRSEHADAWKRDRPGGCSPRPVEHVRSTKLRSVKGYEIFLDASRDLVCVAKCHEAPPPGGLLYSSFRLGGPAVAGANPASPIESPTVSGGIPWGLAVAGLLALAGLFDCGARAMAGGAGPLEKRPKWASCHRISATHAPWHRIARAGRTALPIAAAWHPWRGYTHVASAPAVISSTRRSTQS